MFSCGGFVSLTAVRTVVDAVAEYGRTHVLHLGDSDPSGYSIFQSFAEDVDEFLARECRRGEFTAERVALTLDQMEAWDITGERITTEDERSKAWLAAGITHKAELEVLAPDDIARLLTRAIERHVDADILAEARAQQDADRSDLVARADRAAE